jgi:inner membrane protein
MTGRTHDLAAFTALNLVIATQPIAPVSLPTVLVAFTANFIGGLAPDLDQPTAKLWGNMRGGSFISRLITPLLGGHRFISHSLLGVVLFGVISSYLLKLMNSFLLVDMRVVWWAFMIGFVSHLIMDTFTKEGVPWLFPLPFKLGMPPLRVLRVKTGGLIEKYLIFPGLLLFNGYLFYSHYSYYVAIIKHYIN